MPNFTPNQEKAANDSGTNIIVSAGAGSGKTTVLTERVIRKLKKGISINNLLILTFTNKAAYEMKDRIRKAIEQDKSIIKELDYIDSSYISTFDSYALSMVKKYSYILNISNNLSIADDSIIHLEKERIIDSIFEELYQKEDKDFLEFIYNFTDKKDDQIKEYILKINEKLDLKYNKKEYLDNYISNTYSDSNIKKLEEEYNKFLINNINEIDNNLTILSNYVDTDFYNKIYDSLSLLLDSKTYEEVKSNIEVSLPNLPRGSGEEAGEIKKNISNLIKNLSSLVRFNDSNEMLDTYKSTKNYIKVIIDIINKFDKELNKFKQDHNIYTFTDIAKMAIKILKENEEVREEIKSSFEEIMIDEYQDTSDLQEEFISLISKNNVYMVGDIKQSIYRFRNANPYLFKEKYDNYSKNIGGEKIDLTDNFRSRSEVVNNINLIFSNIMTDNLGGADYKNSHLMIFGNKDYDTVGKLNYNSDFELYNYEYDSKETKYSKDEIEIFFIAQDIKKKVEEHYKVYDRSIKELRDVNYSDFAVLLDRGTSFDLYKKIFEYLGIPLTKYSSTNITEENEIVLIKNILKLIICRKDNNYDTEYKYALTSILRSYLFEYNDQDIFEIVTTNKDNDLIKLTDEIVNNINSISLKEIIYLIIDKFNFYQKFILLGDVKNRINRLTSIIDIFDNLSSLNYTIDDTYNYLDQLIEDSIKIEIKDKDVSPNSVKIMTIHASKGLEFPICYFASLHKEFNIRDVDERFIFDNNYGIIAPFYKDGIGKVFVKDLARYNYLSQELSEKIRLFYVALTRAKEKFIIVTSLKDNLISNLDKASCFLDLINYIKDDIKPYIKELDINKLNLTDEYNLIKKSNYKEAIPKSNNKINIKEININNDIVKDERISKTVKELIDKDTKDKMKFGIKVHEILENIDFKNIDYNDLDIDNYIKDVVKKFINQIDIDKVENIYKEYEFIYLKDNHEYHGVIDLILEYKDHIKIIDYKLKNIDDANYIKQLNSYRDYLRLKTNKKIDIYLYSIIDSKLNKVE